MSRRAKTRPPAKNVSPSLLGAAEEATGAMALAILDLGKLDNSEIRNQVQWSLKSAADQLAGATNWARTFQRIVLAQQNKGLGDGHYDLAPIDAMCAECGDFALLISVPGQPVGVAVCRTCSFPGPGRRAPRQRRAS